MKFTYANPTRIRFGKEQIQAIAKEIPSDQKVLLIYGGGSIKNNGVYDQVCAALADHQLVEFAGVEPNPTVETLDKAVALAKTEQANYVLAVGGGSVIDGAKYVAAAALYDGEGWDIMTGKHRVKQALPLGVVLTLPATGSESNSGAVVTKKATQDKLSFASTAVRPLFAVMDPDVMKSLPERQLINGLVDAWVHVCEQYITYPAGAMVQDGYAETLLRNLKTLADQYDDRDNDQWRANLMWSANQALNGLIGAGVPQDWATHMMGHELTAQYGVDHARSLAMVHPTLLRHQIEAKREKLEQMGRNVFALPASADLAERTIDAIEAFYQQLNVDTQLTGHSGRADDVVDLLVDQLEQHGMVKLGERRAITLRETREILQAVVV